MLDKQTLLCQIKTSLGFPVVELAITDEMILTQIDIAIKKLIPYLNNMEVLEVSSGVTKFKNKRVYTVLRVTSQNDYTSNINLDTAIYRGFYTTGTRNLVDCTLWNYYCDSVQSDLNPIGFRLIGDTLYIDGGNPPYAVEAITDESLSSMTDDYLNWCLDYSIALVKCVEGEIRSKVKITGSPVETNGAELKSEGITEKKDLEEKLGNSLGLFYATR